MVKLLKSKRLQKFKPPVSGDNSKFWKLLLIIHYSYNTIVLIVGSLFILRGYKLVEKGVNGEIEWILKAFGNESTLKNASPGVFLILIGFFIILFARDNVEYKKS